ncbi:glycosyl hydrolase catalytic core-domain-containing protein [Bombardia bombarda]|uniref:Glycosyl hydrolase catalytic core-domain-containing protein n=1 Tax=Bombardia bombarda TaxID=252184 RepID=A0AA39XJ99_9PEZI|nr:glycosyl hydrolase catalytic core-domain-containing protein [Bombardia bombarda]
MVSKILVALAAASLAGEVLALNAHHQGHQHLHQKKDLVTEVVTVTDWITVTITDGESSTSAPAPLTFVRNSRKSRSRSASSVSTTTIPSSIAIPSTAAIPQTTLVTEQKPSTSAEENIKIVSPAVPAPPPVPTSAISSAAAVEAPAAPSSGQSGTALRGLAYNSASLLPSLLGSGSKVHWTYNWGQLDDSNVAVEFVPMLWGTTKGFPDSWATNAQKGINSGSKCLLSFNEPDNDGQANISPGEAAARHIDLMNPFASKARIGTPAITNSGSPNQGIDWMKQFFSACGGKCAADFVVIHIYGVDVPTFLQHVLDVYSAFQKPVWITEFAFDGSDDDVNKSLQTVIDHFENNSTFSFVERYSYFMVAPGSLVASSGNSLSTYGNTFAYSS